MVLCRWIVEGSRESELMDYLIPTPVFELIMLIVGYVWLGFYLQWLNEREESRDRDD